MVEEIEGAEGGGGGGGMHGTWSPTLKWSVTYMAKKV